MTGKAHLLAGYNLFFFKRGQGRCPVFNVKCLEPAIVTDTAFFSRISLPEKVYLGQYRTGQQYQAECRINKPL
jgi:hypothetical protein